MAKVGYIFLAEAYDSIEADKPWPFKHLHGNQDRNSRLPQKPT